MIVEEKMDGTNVCVVRHNDKIIALGRSGYDCEDSPQEQHKMFHRWVMGNKEKFEQLLPNNDDRVVGEWLALAHGTIYPAEKIVQPFMAFDLFLQKKQQDYLTRKESVEQVGLINVPQLYFGTETLAVDDAMAMAEPNSEGVIYRLERMVSKKDTHYTPWVIAKVVKKEKVDGFYLHQETFTWNWVEPIA